jgi:hypothetical protein
MRDIFRAIFTETFQPIIGELIKIEPVLLRNGLKPRVDTSFAFICVYSFNHMILSFAGFIPGSAKP